MSTSDNLNSWARERGVALRAARVEAGLTQDALAAKLGCTRNTVSNAERGTHQLTDDLTESWWRVTKRRPVLLLTVTTT